VGELFQVLGTVSWSGLAAYLVSANLALGLFNLVPAFLTMRMDYARATAIAVAVRRGWQSC
jgi:Zn-dependent protease